MTSRRTVLGSSLAAAGLSAAVGRHFPQRAEAALKHPLDGVLGLELYSLREQLKKDVPGTLAKARAMGFADVEVAGTQGKTADEYAALLKKAGLKPQSMHLGFEKLRDDMQGAIKEAKALGVGWVVCPWLPHKGKLTKEDIGKATDAFNKFGKELKAAEIGFAYHVHGYEFEPSPDGTLMDTMIKGLAPEAAIQIDVFWVRRGGEDPVKLMERYPGRFPLMHLKDIAKGLDICRPNGGAPDDTSVPLGAGMIDWPGVLRAAKTAGTKIYFIEDEHPESVKQIPQSLKYLRTLKL